jgi:HEAT repeat protein
MSEANELGELLAQLADLEQPISFSSLYALSDLTGETWTQFRRAWRSFGAEQRRRLIQALVQLAEASFEVNFDTIFLLCLDDPDEEVRTMAINGLWEHEDAGLIGPLIAMLRADPSARVRATAASGLGRFVLAGELEKLAEPIQARILSELLTTIHLANESVEVRRRAIESAAYSCTPEMNEVLEIAYYDDDESMRISAITGMGRSCDRRWSEQVLRELQSDSNAMRYEAALASGELGLRQAIPFLAELMQDADRQIAEASIWALGQIGGRQARELLMAAYENADEDSLEVLDEALAEHALADGDLDFVLYSLEEEEYGEAIDEDMLVLWSAEDVDDDVEQDE